VAKEEIAIRKRQQIARANRTMFMWVAIVSIVVGIAIVATIFLLQKGWFNERILAEKGKTASTLTDNNKVIEALKEQVRVLNTNEALKSSMVSGETQPVQVVLDALPDTANSSALGSSLQEKFLNGNGLTVETLVVDPVVGVESQVSQNVQDASRTTSQNTGANTISFRFSVSTPSSNANALKELLQKLERSIRAIDITSLDVETQGAKLVLSVQGYAYYELAKTVELKDKVVRP
jgi:hypothetical protein